MPSHPTTAEIVAAMNRRDSADQLRVERSGIAMDACDTCGTKINNKCPGCGAPQCCPQCCAEGR